MPDADPRYTDVQTHSALRTGSVYWGGVWSVECRVCHSPHYQQQATAPGYQFDPAVNIATGTVTALASVPGATVSSMTDTGKVFIPNQYVGCLLVANMSYPSRVYRIRANDAQTLSVDGAINLNYTAVGMTYGIRYGRLVNASIGTPNSGVRPVRFFNDAGPASFASSSLQPDGICQVCHTRTASFTVNGVLEGPGHPAGTAGVNCTACHRHQDGFKKSDKCLDCHSISIGARAAITPALMANSHHIQGITLSDNQCYQCHWEANSDGSVNAAYHGGWTAPGAPVDLVIYGLGTRPPTYVLGSTAVLYTPNGTRSELQKINGHCLGCHSEQNNSTQPFGDGKTPKHYAWDGTSIAARYLQTGTTPWGKYSGANTSPKNTVIKAFSAHGNAVNNQGGWDLNENWTNTRNGTVNVLCFDCHNAHGSGIEGPTTTYVSETENGGILKDTVAGLGGYAMTYKPVSGGTTTDKNVRTAGASLCMDCHLTASAGTNPWGYGSTFGESAAIIGYYDSQYLAPGATGSQLRYTYKALHFNAGGHFGASKPLSSTPLGTIGGLCTPCHDPHGVSPILGADQQYGVPMLKGTWLTSPYKEDVAPAVNAKGTVRDATYPLGYDQMVREGVQYHIDQNTFGANIKAAIASGITQTEGQFAGLCLRCHPRSSLTDGVNGGAWKSVDRIHESVKGWGANVKHNYVCSKCHTPHNGSALPRLMVTNCLNKEHKGRVGSNPNPVLGGSGYGDDAGCWGDSVTLGGCPYYPLYTTAFSSGGGRFPGTFDGYYYSDNYGTNAFTVSCHEGQTGSVNDQGWNIVTPWTGTP